MFMGFIGLITPQATKSVVNTIGCQVGETEMDEFGIEDQFVGSGYTGQGPDSKGGAIALVSSALLGIFALLS